jgi:hypothetical protein
MPVSMKEHQAMRRPTGASTEIPLSKEVKDYLGAHPEVAEYFKRVEKAQEAFGKFLRLTGSQMIVRDLAGASTSEADLNGSLSRTNR